MSLLADVVVAGAGPVGLATAICCAERGLSVAVLEKRTGTQDKACGEGILPSGVAALRAMGVEIPSGECADFSGIRYVDGERVAQGVFPVGSGVGVRRPVLVECLTARARELGVDIRYGASVEGWDTRPDALALDTTIGVQSCRFLVAADGLHSSLRKRAGLHVESPRQGRYGIRRHFRIKPWSSFVEVHWADGAEAYVTPVGPELVGVALLWDGDGGPFERLLQLFPNLVARLSGAETATSVRGAGPFDQHPSALQRGRVVLIGDAAGYLDPLTGEGISLGFRSARVLAEVLAKGAPLRVYERACAQLGRNHRLLTRALLKLRRHPRLRSHVVAGLARDPRLFERMLAIHGGQRPRLADIAHLTRALLRQ